MAGSIMPKLEMIFEKLGKVEEKLDKLEKQVKGVDRKLSELQGKVKSFEKCIRDGKIKKKLEDGMYCAHGGQRKL